jgi:16S rRNA (guanine966-N2)-methyltransferase
MGKQSARVAISAGSLKGRRLEYPETGVRPTMQRTREAIFSSIDTELHGVVFVDLCAAGGAMGLEAISRGARECHFVERDPATAAALRANVDRCGVILQAGVAEAGAMEWLTAGGLESVGDCIVFADPPYDDDLGAKLLAHFQSTSYPRLKLLIIEGRDTPGQHSAETEVGLLRLDKEKTYGDARVSYFRPEAG